MRRRFDISGTKSSSAFMAEYVERLITIDCPLCRRSSTTEVGSRSRGGLPLETVVCNGCGLIYLNPKPSADKYAQFYASGDYRRFLNMVKGRRNFQSLDNFINDEKFETRKADGMNIARQYFGSILGKGDLFFDFGCDTGGFMAGVREETGCDIMGNEPSELCAAYIKDKLGLSIINSTMEEIDKEDRRKYRGRVKVASIVGTLEHVSDPVNCLGVANEVLVDRGYLYVESFDILRRMKMKREAVGDVATIDHQYYFHSQVYDYMLRLCGFQVIYFDYAGSKANMMKVLSQKVRSVSYEIGYDVALFIREIMRLNDEAESHHKSFRFKGRKAVNNAKARMRRLGSAFQRGVGFCKSQQS